MDQKKLPLCLLVVFSFVSLSLCGSCVHPVYCTGPLLDVIQRSSIFNDSKTFVDMPMKYPPDQVLASFHQQFPNISSVIIPAELLQFVNQNFYSAGSDLLAVVPVDWVPNPSFLNQINDTKMREFALNVHDKWHVLVREWNHSFCEGCHSHIPVEYPFVIAGSRFREFYYWDSYWTIQGLLLVIDFGFVPNGGRIYYLNRSQPPMLTQMVEQYFEATKDVEFLEYALPILNLEYEFWMSNTSVEPAPGFVLNRYYVINDAPRPESYYEDVLLAATAPPAGIPYLYQQLATGAETGWDFSSRWMQNQPNLASLETINVIPVDLNSILYKNEVALATFYTILKQPDMETLYLRRAQQRLRAIRELLWNDAVGAWNDRYVNGSFDTRYYTSNLVPLWAGAFLDLSSEQISGILRNLSEVFSYPGGVPTSLLNTAQQWDFPNGWAPLQYFVIMGLNTVAHSEGLDYQLRAQCAQLAFEVATKWLTTNFCGWNETGMMFEKYDVMTRGAPGHGGEYTVQDGFGWTNGVALHLIQLYGNKFSLETCGP